MTKPYFYVQWDSTSRCNLNCLHCYHTKEERQTRYVMTHSEAKSMLDDLAQTVQHWGFRGGIHFSGGEPLVRSDIFELIGYSRDLNLELRMLSNGTLINPQNARKLKESGLKIVQVSIDGTRDTHDYLRNRRDAYDLAMRGIRNLRDADIEPTAATTLTKTNFSQIEEIVELVFLAGARRIGFSQLVPEGSGKDLEMLSAEELYDSFLKLHSLREKYHGKIDILSSESLWCLFDEENEYTRRAKEEGILAGGCGIAMFGLSVLSDGTAYPCRRLPIDIGNIKEGIQAIFIKNKVLNQFRDINNYKCKGCEKVTICRGCRAVAYAVTGNAFAKDPQCFKHIIDDKNGQTTID
ncbi:radical SAM protein [Candidatus Woesearchaeota archaeon]|nr:radical SAM protein [Candidatus Woesearchaeota archaeon]